MTVSNSLVSRSDKNVAFRKSMVTPRIEMVSNGLSVGALEGELLGELVGELLGLAVLGRIVGGFSRLCSSVGLAVGSPDGCKVDSVTVGALVGSFVGERVGGVVVGARGVGKRVSKSSTNTLCPLSG